MRARAPAASPGALLFFALLGVTLLVTALVVRARTPDLALEVVDLTPRELTMSEDADGTRITLFVRVDDPRAEVSIVDPDRRVVRTLAGPVSLEAGRREIYRWDGHTDAGRWARPGRYRVRVELPERGRDMVWPRPIILDWEPGEDDDGARPRS